MLLVRRLRLPTVGFHLSDGRWHQSGPVVALRLVRPRFPDRSPFCGCPGRRARGQLGPRRPSPPVGSGSCCGWLSAAASWAGARLQWAVAGWAWMDGCGVRGDSITGASMLLCPTRLRWGSGQRGNRPVIAAGTGPSRFVTDEAVLGPVFGVGVSGLVGPGRGKVTLRLFGVLPVRVLLVPGLVTVTVWVVGL